MRTLPELLPLVIHAAAVFGFAAGILQAYL